MKKRFEKKKAEKKEVKEVKTAVVYTPPEVKGINLSVDEAVAVKEGLTSKNVSEQSRATIKDILNKIG